MPHAEIFFLRFDHPIRVLIEPNLLHLVLNVILDVEVALLFLHVRIVLVFPFNLFGLLNAIKSVNLCLITLQNGRSYRLLLLLISFKLINLVVILKAKSVSRHLSGLILAFLLDDFELVSYSKRRSASDTVNLSNLLLSIRR